MPGIDGPTRYSVNSIGVRGDEMPERRDGTRVLCIGGSTTECVYLDDRSAWPRLLQDLLAQRWSRSVWVGSIGVSGYTTNDHLRFVRESSLMDRVDCAVMLVGSNDLGQAIGKIATPMWSRSRLLGLVRNTFHWGAALEVEDEAGWAYVARRQSRAIATKRDVAPDVSSAIAQYTDRIRELAELCRAKGVRPVYVNQPTLVRAEMSAATEQLLWGGRLTNGEFLTPRAFSGLVDRYNAALEATSRDIGVQCIDVTSMNGRSEFFYDDWHFSVAGAREIARLIAERLEEPPPRS